MPTARRPQPLDVYAIRARLGLTQQQFARRFAFSVRTLRRWEQSTRTPTGPALALLRVIDRDPHGVASLLAPPATIPRAPRAQPAPLPPHADLARFAL